MKQQNAALATSYQKKVDELKTYQDRDQELSQVLQSIALELPKCNIEFALPTPQKLRRVADRAKALEEIVTRMKETTSKMEEDYKAQIAELETELEARPPGTPHADKEARIEAFWLTSVQMKSRIDEALLVLEEATNTWVELDASPEKVEV